MANYKGYFRAYDATTANTAGTLYCVEIIGDTGSTGFTEIKLAANNPFTVSYGVSNTAFEPLRTSTATISVVHNDYMEDILSPYAQGTQIKLLNTDKNIYEWVGFLTPKLYNQPYVDEYETIELEAADCISSLQYIDYTSGNPRSMVTIAQILAQICDACQLLEGYYWTRSKRVGNTVLLPSHLKISEQNFYSTDTDEPWDLQTVLEEMCRYFGFTAIQEGTKLYLVDYQYYHSNDDIYATWYSKASNYTQGSASHIGGAYTMTQDDIRQTGADISFEPIYNKCTVKANFSACDEFIPNIFDDSLLTNRIDPENFYANYEVLPEVPNVPKYPYGTEWFAQAYKDDKLSKKDNGGREDILGDAKYRYFHRLYDNKYWESVYYNPDGTAASPSAEVQATSSITRDYAGGTIVDLGVVRKDYVNEYYQWVVPNRLDYTRYLCISQKGLGNFHEGYDKPVLKLKDGFHPLAPYSQDSFLVIYFSLIFERYVNRAYITPSWTTELIKMGGIVGSQASTDGFPWFKLRIGDKYWAGTGWTTTESIFEVVTERTIDDVGTFNQERKTLNNVSWDLFINEEGYKIPLAGTDPTAEVDFQILFPSIQVILNLSQEWNQYCWIKDLSIKCARKGQAAEEAENDVIYENIIDQDSINDAGDITVKFTTATNLTEPSYSNVVYSSGSANSLLSAVTEDNLSGNAQKPEENIVEKYVSQYSTQTKKIQTTVGMDITPFHKIYGVDVDSPSAGYVVLGGDIDYSYARQTITLLEKK